MQLLLSCDSTRLRYWLNWRVLLCAVWVLTPMFVASYMIRKYECLDHSESDKRGIPKGRTLVLCDDAWRPCVKEIHPFYLLAYRVLAFCLLLWTLVLEVIAHGPGIFYYYTQWTFTLVTIYFGLGSLLSIFGCYQHHKMCSAFSSFNVGIDTEHGLCVPLTSEETVIRIGREENSGHQEKSCFIQIAQVLSYAFQVIFQMNAGAVMLTDSIYWFIIFPFLTIKDYELSFLTVTTHSLNLVLLSGEAALNCLKFPWFRISFFIMWTGVYVIFQWTVHACVKIWWPYPFLDLSQQYAPLWYFLVALLHLPCYAIFALIVYVKQSLLSRWCPQSHQCLR